MRDRRFLIVDDDEFTLETTSFILSSLGGKQIETVSNARDALLRISTEPRIDTVITDLNMPEMDGIDLIRAFQGFGFQGDIIIFSGEDQQTLELTERLARERNLSILGALKKPLQRHALATLLQLEHENVSAERPSNRRDISEDMLRGGISSRQIIPWYQPKVRVSDGAVEGVELLARWPQSALGPVYPDEFIPVAETCGLIDELTFSLLSQAIEDMKCWRAAGFNLKLAINISMLSLQSLRFVKQLEQQIKLSDIPFDRFQLEVTESRLMDDIVTPLDALVRFRMKKLSLSIDDFGTGHSNLAQLRDLPFDEVKLDKSFVQGALHSEKSRIILESSFAIASKLNMQTVAEGVETPEEWALLKTLGCHQVQGYLISKPIPFRELQRWLEDWQSNPQVWLSLSERAEDQDCHAEVRRLHALHDLNILDTRPEEAYDRITRLAAKIFNVPISLVSLVDRDRQWFKSRVGVSISETSRDIAFCAEAIMEERPLVVPDTHLDPRFSKNPLVLKSPYMRFYAGVPLVYSDGSKLGTLCIIDTQPKEITDRELDILGDLAAMVQEELCRTISEKTDALTSALKHAAFEEQAQSLLMHSENTESQLLFLGLCNFKHIVVRCGRQEANARLRAFGHLLASHLGRNDIFSRVGNDEFVVLFAGKPPAQVVEWITDLKAIMKGCSTLGEVDFICGMQSIPPGCKKHIATLIDEAESNALLKKYPNI